MNSLHDKLYLRSGLYRKWQSIPQVSFWNFIILVLVGLIVTSLVVAAISSFRLSFNEISPKENPITDPSLLVASSTVPNLKVAFLGDQSLSEEAQAVMDLVRDEGAELIVHTGDFDYRDHEDLWHKQITDALGPNFPVIAAAGNHEVRHWPAYSKKLLEIIRNNPDIKCTGNVGVKQSCYYKGLFVVVTAPGTIDANHDIYADTELTKDRSVWSVCAWHKNQMKLQVGNDHRGDETGWEIYETCRKHGAMIVNSHDHSYARSHLLSNMENQTIHSTSSRLVLQKGATFVTVTGLGGHSINKQRLGGEWWARVYNESQNANFGALFCTFHIEGDPTRAFCYFKDIDGRVPDTFEMISRVE